MIHERTTNTDPQPMPQPTFLPVTITAVFLDKILTLLAPLFLAATGGDVSLAREAVRATLAGYNARTDDEVRLAALVVAFGFGALDALGQAANPDLSLNQVMRLRSNATALSRAGHQNQAVLDKVRKQASAEPAPEPEPAAPELPASIEPPVSPELPASIETPDLLAFARSVMQARTLATAAPLSRQQRRAAERHAEKARLRQKEDARRTDRAAARELANHAAAPQPSGA
jgi:hypothetical protein